MDNKSTEHEPREPVPAAESIFAIASKELIRKGQIDSNGPSIFQSPPNQNGERAVVHTFKYPFDQESLRQLDIDAHTAELHYCDAVELDGEVYEPFVGVFIYRPVYDQSNALFAWEIEYYDLRRFQNGEVKIEKALQLKVPPGAARATSGRTVEKMLVNSLLGDELAEKMGMKQPSDDDLRMLGKLVRAI